MSGVITRADLIARFAQFTNTPEATVNVYIGDAGVEMGLDRGRWIGQYVQAQCNLVAHMLVVAAAQAAGDENAIMPVRLSEVDDVVVENAVSRQSENNFDEYNATSYGQRYVKLRAQAFSGPRVA